MADVVKIMTYNVENLFDTEDDPGKEDETYLPLALKKGEIKSRCKTLKKHYYVDECLTLDWSNDLLDKKMQRLSDVVLQVNNGKGPDILILEEVENKNVLEKWRNSYLKPAGYSEAILIEGKDDRGIDVAMLTRLPLEGEAKLHDIDFTIPEDEKSKHFKSRGILQTRLKLSDGTILNVFGGHFPSQGSTTPYRERAILKMNELKKTIPDNELAVAGGDFNITVDEDRKHGLYNKQLASEWKVSHMIGCHDCKGTEYYPRNREWSFLDALLFHPKLTDSKSAWQVNVDSIQVPQESKYQWSRFGTPARFNNGKSKTGVSDHWPVYAELVLMKKTN